VGCDSSLQIDNAFFVTVTHAQDIIVDACMVAKFGIWGAHAKF
jgi:hypothetical protein